jgi:hypothetical protein
MNQLQQKIKGGNTRSGYLYIYFFNKNKICRSSWVLNKKKKIKLELKYHFSKIFRRKIMLFRTQTYTHTT